MTQPAPVKLPRALLTLSMQGGVGKTTTVIGLAKALHCQGIKVAGCPLNITDECLTLLEGAVVSRDPG